VITSEVIEDGVVELLRRAVCDLPADVKDRLTSCASDENGDVARMQFEAMLENVEVAAESGLPLCQDTGVHIFYVALGMPYRDLDFDLEDTNRRGVARATGEVPLRPNAVAPLPRKNPGTNVGERMPAITYELSDSPYIEFRVVPKGAGSENMSALKMLNPSLGVKGVKEFVLETVKAAGSKPCPPTVVGVGVGGTADLALKIAKLASMRPIGSRHPDPEVAQIERDLHTALNELGIGPMGLGGKTTVLDVMLEKAHCHTATLPVGVNLTCYAARRHGMRVYSDGRVEMLEG